MAAPADKTESWSAVVNALTSVQTDQANSEHRRPIRVLQVVGRMNRGGSETWLMHILRQIDRSKFQVDFLTHTDQECAYDGEIRRLGSSLLACGDPHNPWKYAASFRDLMRSRGPYDVVHTHLHHFNGFVLRCAAQAKIPVRIAHSHSDTAGGDAAAGFLRRVYLRINKAWIARYATRGLAVSQAAAGALFGQGWQSDARFSVLYCGVDLTSLEQAASSREGLCREFNLASDAMILGHIGRFTQAKNHRFLIEIFARVKQLEPRAVLILAGDGELRSEIENWIIRAGVQDSCRLIGIRSDIPRLFAGIDALLLPSRWEGLPLVLIEAQAAGVPCVCSDAITQEAVERSSLVTRLPVSHSADEWARATIQAVIGRGLLAGKLQSLAGSRFDIQVGVRELEKLYVSDAARRVAGPPLPHET